jgi:hypothetical protein
MLKLKHQGVTYAGGYIKALLDNPELIEHLSAYKRRVAGNYRPITPEEIKHLPASNYLVSEKIDGELWFLVLDGENSFLTNATGKVIHGDLPLLQEADSLPKGDILVGELYAVGASGRPRVGDLSSVLSEAGQERCSDLRFAAFDGLAATLDENPISYPEKLARIKTVLLSSQYLKPLESYGLSTATDIQEFFTKHVAEGKAEGIVIRHESGLIYKAKPHIEIDAAIVGFTKRVDQADQARSILLALMWPDETFQILGACGNLGSDADRSALLSQLESDICPSQVRIASENGGLYAFVKPKLVAQLKLTDIQKDRSDGTPTLTHKMMATDQGWESKGQSPFGRPIHPVLQRIRSDKMVNSHDVRVSQFDGLISLEASAPSGSNDLSKSKIIRREVWEKETKGVKAVRKLVVIKTNKSNNGSHQPAFVIHWTDYSPGRASPLDREVKLAQSDQAANAIAEVLIAENIKKGWVKTS